MHFDLKSISITNYKGLEQVDIENLQAINSFIGPNNAGKSTVLKAIYSFITGNITGEDVRKTSQRVFPVSLKGLFKINDPEVDEIVETHLDQAGIMDDGDRNAIGKYVKLFRLERLLQAEPGGVSTTFINALEAHLPAHLSDTRWSVIKSSAVSGPFGALRSWLVGYIQRKIAPRLSVAYSVLVPSTRIGLPFPTYNLASNTIAQKVLHLWRESAHRRVALDELAQHERLDRSFSAFDPRTTGLVYETEVINRQASEMPLDTKGQGEQDAIEIRARVLNPIIKPDFLFLDEPENSKHPSLQRRVRQWFVELSKEHQVFISTHSSVFAYPHTMGVYLVEKKGMLKHISNAQTGGSDLRIAVGVLNSDILAYDRVLFVEGDTEENFIHEVWLRMKSGGVPPSVRIVNLKGADKFRRHRLKELLEFLKETWVEAHVWLDLKAEVERYAEEIRASYPGVFRRRDDVVIWKKDRLSTVDFEDMFPHQVLLRALDDVVLASGGQKTEEVSFSRKCSKGAVRALEEAYATALKVSRKDFPKAEFGIQLGRAVAAEIGRTPDQSAVHARFPVIQSLERALQMDV